MNYLLKTLLTMTTFFLLMVVPAHSTHHEGSHAGANNLALKNYNDSFKPDYTTVFNNINYYKKYANRVIANIGRVNDVKIIKTTYTNLLLAEAELKTLASSNNAKVRYKAEQALRVVRNAIKAVKNRAEALKPPVDLSKQKKPPKPSPFILEQDIKF